jgi:hypothetical protein
MRSNLVRRPDAVIALASGNVFAVQSAMPPREPQPNTEPERDHALSSEQPVSTPDQGRVIQTAENRRSGDDRRRASRTDRRRLAREVK